MCVSNQYTYVYPDGRKEKSALQTSLCSASRHGTPCPNHITYRYPAQPYKPATTTYMPASAQFPPTPTHTPGPATPVYRSGDESDRSAGYRSGSSSRGSRRHHSPSVYVHGKKAYENGSTSSRHGERVVLVNAPPTPGTPPTKFTAPHTAPSSPSTPFVVEASPRRTSSTRHRPVTVDERSNRINVDIFDVEPRHHKKSHRYSTSSSSYSHGESDSSSRRHKHKDKGYSYWESDSSSRRHKKEKEKRESDKEHRRQSQRDSRIRDRIERANAEIASRPAVPMHQEPLRHSSATSYASDTDAKLADALRGLGISDSSSGRSRVEYEEEAQRRRLRERMMPKRRASVGPGSRREREVYGDGVYRWE